MSDGVAPTGSEQNINAAPASPASSDTLRHIPGYTRLPRRLFQVSF